MWKLWARKAEERRRRDRGRGCGSGAGVAVRIVYNKIGERQNELSRPTQRSRSSSAGEGGKLEKELGGQD